MVRLPQLALNLTRPVLLVLALIVLLSSPAPAQSQADRDHAFVRIHVLDLLENEARLPLPVQQRREALLAYYGNVENGLLFVGTGRAEALVTRLAEAAADGLKPEDYPTTQLAALVAALPDTDLRSQAVIELHLAAAFLQYASDLKVGRFLPAQIDPDFFLAERQIDQSAALAGLASASDLSVFVDSYEPPAPDYQALKVLLADYRSIAARGGWPSVPMGETLKPGMTDDRVVALRERLDVTDPGISPPENPAFYDSHLEDRVRRFQTRMGLDVDGAIGPATYAALNAPVEERIDSIIVSMERWRWMPDDLGVKHIIVNIAGFELRLYENGAEADRMNVVVGKPFTRTPVFSDEIEYLEINPYWNVPASIIFGEMLPELQSNPASLASRGFEAVRGGQVYDLRQVDWSAYTRNNFPFTIRQKPGADNALGRVKFMLPNTHDIYLHDSPARSLYDRSVRAFSHGCIRLSRPLDLIPEVLTAGDISGWDRAKVNQVLATGERTIVTMATKLPVHITYLTAWSDDGVPNFRADIYEHDKKLLAALDGRAVSW
ncbi:MAG: L,D-transpeptidase family protein [Hyphomicrobiaceae bacterium]|nr:L,D-transpeptidase family protein [Hyphomicrobiaceae bacterium]